MNRRDRCGVLRGERDERAHAVAAGGREGLQVGLDARATARVGRGDRETAWNGHALPSPALPGSGSTGVISASVEAPRSARVASPGGLPRYDGFATGTTDTCDAGRGGWHGARCWGTAPASARHRLRHGRSHVRFGARLDDDPSRHSADVDLARRRRLDSLEADASRCPSGDASRRVSMLTHTDADDFAESCAAPGAPGEEASSLGVLFRRPRREGVPSAPFGLRARSATRAPGVTPVRMAISDICPALPPAFLAGSCWTVRRALHPRAQMSQIESRRVGGRAPPGRELIHLATQPARAPRRAAARGARRAPCGRWPARRQGSTRTASRRPQPAASRSAAIGNPLASPPPSDGRAWYRGGMLKIYGVWSPSRARSTSTRRRRSPTDQARGSPSSASRASSLAIYDGDTEAHAAVADPEVVEPDPDQPGHAPRRRPAAPRPLGRRARQPPLRRRRRGARLPRRVRPHVGNVSAGSAGSPASTAPILSSSSPQRRSRTPASSPAGSWAGGDSGRRRRRAAGRADDRPLEPSARRRGARPAGKRPRRGVAPAGRTRLRGLRTICFAKSRKAAELIHRFTVERVGDSETARRLAPYRAGYTPAQRREIERRLVEGDLLGVTATDALELGIDIGLLDCAIAVRFPGTVASLRQQWGRAGRRHGLAVLVASEDALDQYFMREPDTPPLAAGRGGDPRPREPADPGRHVRAAVFEAPLDDRDRAVLGDEALERAALQPDLKATPAGYVWDGRDYPAARVPPPLDEYRLDHHGGHGDGLAARDRRARAGVLDRPRGRGLPPSRRAVPRAGARPRRAPRVVEPFRGHYYTQAKKDTETAIDQHERRLESTSTSAPSRSRSRSSRSRRSRSRTGPAGPSSRSRCRRRRSTPRRSGSPAARAARRSRPDAEPLHVARCGALADRRAAPVGDVRPLGHRRALHERPLRPGGPRSSSTTATPAASASSSAASTASRGG